jgi:cytochrome c553
LEQEFTMFKQPFEETLMKRHLTSRRMASAAILALAAASLHAQTPPPGRLLASNCFQCHGTNGKGPGFESLAGKSANEIYEDLLEFRSGKEGNGLMAKHALGYTDQQLRQLSQWLSTQR